MKQILNEQYWKATKGALLEGLDGNKKDVMDIVL